MPESWARLPLRPQATARARKRVLTWRRRIGSSGAAALRYTPSTHGPVDLALLFFDPTWEVGKWHSHQLRVIAFHIRKAGSDHQSIQHCDGVSV